MTSPELIETSVEEFSASRDHSATKWTDDVITGAIFAIKSNGGLINAKSLEIYHASLCQAIFRRPGGWVRYVELAGFNPEQESVASRGGRNATNTAKLRAAEQKSSR